MNRAAVTIHTLKRMKDAGEKICMVTAYDATSRRILDEAGADVLLVGDSLGMVVQGHDSTLPVTMDQMVYHSPRCAAAWPAKRRPRGRRPAVHELPGVRRRGGQATPAAWSPRAAWRA